MRLPLPTGLAARNRWEEMAVLIDDHMLDAFAVIAGPDDLPGRLMERYLGLADRLMVYQPFIPGNRDEFWKGLVKSVQHG
jgi:hypothetical protein